MFEFGADIKTAGTGSVLVSVPTVGMGLWRYAQAGAFADRGDFPGLVLPMGFGSVVGAVVGGLLVPFVQARALKLLLGGILIASALEIFRRAPHRQTAR